MTVHTKFPLLYGLGGNPVLPYELARRLLGHPVGRSSVARAYAGIDAELRSVILESDDAHALVELAASPRTPADIRWLLAAHDDPWVRVATMRGGGDDPEATPGSGSPDDGLAARIVAKLAADPDPEVRASVARTAHTPDDVRCTLVSDPDPMVRIALATSWPDPPEAQRRALLTDPDPKVRTAAVTGGCRWSIPADLVGVVLADPEIRADAADLVPLNPELARQFARDEDELVRSVAAAAPQLADAYEMLRDDPSQWVRMALITREDLSDEQRVGLWDELDAEEPQFKGRHGFPATAFVGMMWAGRNMPWLRVAPTATRERHARSPLAFIRCVAASVGDLCLDTVMELLAETDSYVPQVVAVIYGDDLPGEVLRQVVETYGEPRGFGPGLTTRPHFPPEAFAEWAARTGPDEPRLRYLGASRGTLSADLVERLAVDESSSLRAAAARQASVSPATLERLLADPEPFVAQAAASSPLLPVPAMRAILSSAGL